MLRRAPRIPSEHAHPDIYNEGLAAEKAGAPDDAPYRDDIPHDDRARAWEIGWLDGFMMVYSKKLR